jgi:predicted ArsR family transcriptional regulator
MATRKKAPSSKAKPAKATAFPKGKDTKQQRLIAMLKRSDGATIAQMAKAFGWERHTVRGALSSALKKKLGLRITSEKPETGERVYRIA